MVWKIYVPIFKQYTNAGVKISRVSRCRKRTIIRLLKRQKSPLQRLQTSDTRTHFSSQSLRRTVNPCALKGFQPAPPELRYNKLRTVRNRSYKYYVDIKRTSNTKIESYIFISIRTQNET